MTENFDTMTPEEKKEVRLGIIRNVVNRRCADLFERFRNDEQAEETINFNHECGYPDVIEAQDYLAFFIRVGIATRIITVFADESWKVQPEIYEDEDPNNETEFEAAVKALVNRVNLWNVLERVDKLSGIGNYAVMLLGFDDLKPNETLNKPVAGVTGRTFDGTETNQGTVEGAPTGLRFIRVLTQTLAPIAGWDLDPSSERCGWPSAYNVRLLQSTLGQVPGGMRGAGNIIPTGETSEGFDNLCHWSRIVHVADEVATNEALGTPKLENVYNYVFDHRKVLGGACQMFWAGGFPGLAFEIDAELLKAGVQVNKDELDREIEEYLRGLERKLLVKGGSVKNLSPSVADPTGHLAAIIEAICISKAIPQRVFAGSERGELASSQDAEAWADRIRKRQTTYVTPCIIRRLIDRLIEAGVLPTPTQPYKVEWPNVKMPSPDAIATRAQKLSLAISTYANSSAAQDVYPPAEFFALILQHTPEEVLRLLEAQDERIEARASGEPIPGEGEPVDENQTGDQNPTQDNPTAEATPPND